MLCNTAPMFIWQTFHTVIDGTKIRLDMLDQGGQTAGWVVRRACNVYQVFKPPTVRPDSGVVDLLTDGVLVGQAATPEGARELLQEELAISETGRNPVLRLHAAH